MNFKKFDAIGFWGDTFVLIFVDYWTLFEDVSSHQEFNVSSSLEGLVLPVDFACFRDT